MDEMSQCRPPEGAENHWFKHKDHGYRLYERISGTALGTFWMYRDFGGKSETLAAEGWTYHLPASPDDATERARLEQEVERLWEALRAKPVAGDPVFMVLHELQQENIRLRGSLERIARFDHKNAAPWTHQAAADAYWLALDGCRLIARAALTPGATP